MRLRAPFVQCAVASVAALLSLSLPAWAEGREAELLAQLRAADTPYAAALVAREIEALWSRSGSAAIDLLLQRGQEALERGDRIAAIEHLTAAIDHDPTFAEPYAARAAAYYLSGHVGPAIDDLREALVLNPHHWEAMKGLAAVLEELGRKEEALEVWRRVTEINPQDSVAETQAARLALQLEGRAL
jgi:tetratricopeptide (TPR) repeat protein